MEAFSPFTSYDVIIQYYTRFQCYVHRQHLCSSFDMLCNGCLTVKQAIRIIRKKFANIACFQIYRIMKQFVCSRLVAQ